jgi:hypothetical protein
MQPGGKIPSGGLTHAHLTNTGHSIHQPGRTV